MLNKKKLDTLKKKYNISDNEIKSLGINENEIKIASGRLSRKEHEDLIKACYDKNSNVSESIRKYIIKMIKNSKINTIAVKELKKKKIQKGNSSPVTLRLEENIKKQFEDLCNKNYVSESSVIRYIAVTISNRQRKEN